MSTLTYQREYGYAVVLAPSEIGDILYRIGARDSEHIQVIPAGSFLYRGREYTGELFLKRATFDVAWNYTGLRQGWNNGAVSTKTALAICYAAQEAVRAHMAANPEVEALGEKYAAQRAAVDLAATITKAEADLELKRAELARLMEVAGTEPFCGHSPATCHTLRCFVNEKWGQQ